MKTTLLPLVMFVAVFTVSGAWAQEGALETPLEKTSYSLGVQIGKNLGAQEVELNMDAFLRGITDAMEGAELALTDEAMQQIMSDFRTEMMTKQRERRERQQQENLEEGQAFLEENAQKEGVTVLDSGLQYEVLQEGTGDTPAASDRVRVHYKGTLIDGTVFDSSYERGEPVEFRLGGVIRGWQEALQLMEEGAKWKLYIPPDLGYGARGKGQIPPNAVLIFEVELLEVLEETVVQPESTE